ncbi:MAG: histidine kinase [Anaerolineae bacterium]|nr:MAG: histidine kinase [Anaerolineae bacterium]WKZ45767.1 MAG: response regulator [Anaerolineales bacterium]WKZ48414.1 MAG: response regulator [Anaerolineales bacterium]
MAPGDKIRVLIVDDVSETRENVRKLLQFESDVDVVGVARTGKEAIQSSLEFDPDVVLMDINMPDMDGIAATEAIRAKQPAVQVVILSVQNDQNYMRRAMLVGARDFLTKPPMGDELISAIRRAGAMSQSERSKSVVAQPSAPMAGMSGASFGYTARGKIITIYSPKGGAGCTTLAVNLAIALNNDDTRVALVDANLQFGDVAMFVNEQGKNTIADLTPRAEELDPEIVEEVMVKHAASGLHILAAPSRPEYADKVTSGQLSKVLEYLKQMYAYVIVDTSAYLTENTLAVIDISDLIVLVTTQDIPSIKSCRLFLDLLQTMGVERERILFVMNRFDKRVNITPDRVAENLKQEVASVIPLDEQTVTKAVNRGIPFMLDARNQLAGRGILSLAESVRARVTAIESGGEADRVGRR